jgi:myo-inositol-1-phosphate synthase
MKSPMNQQPDDAARTATEEFIAHYARAEKVSRAAREKKVSQAEKVEAPAE